MILKIMSDIKYFLIILAVVLTGFAMAFWIISYPNTSLPFGTIPQSFITAFLYMLGQNINPDFSETASGHLGVVLLVLFMLFMMILMLNLLIALMGNSFKIVQNKGLAQWRLEQASMMLEQRFMITDGVLKRHCHFGRIHVLKYAAAADKTKYNQDAEEWSVQDYQQYTNARLDELSAASQEITNTKLEALTVQQQKSADAKFETFQQYTTAKFDALAAAQAAADAKIDALDNKLDSILNKLNNNNAFANVAAKPLAAMLNTFNAATGAASASVNPSTPSAAAPASSAASSAASTSSAVAGVSGTN